MTTSLAASADGVCPGQPRVSPLWADTLLVRHEFQRAEGIYPAWFCLAHPPQERLEAAAFNFLGPRERELLANMRVATRRRNYLLGRYCAKEALAAWLGNLDRTKVEVMAGVFQQPVVVGEHGNAVVSISHGAGVGMAVAFGEAHPLAVDVEQIDAQRVDTMRSQMTGAETAMLRGWPWSEEEGTALVWTAKEALSKVLRTGMTSPMTLYELEDCRWESGCLLSTFRAFHQYRSLGWVSGGAAFSVVMPRRSALGGSQEAFRTSLSLGLPG